MDTVDFERGKVSLQDMTMAKEARYPLFREEPVEFVRALYEPEEPQFDFATEEQVFIANRIGYINWHQRNRWQ